MQHTSKIVVSRHTPWATALLALMLLVACAQVDAPSATHGTISGTLSYGATATAVEDVSIEARSASPGRIAVAGHGASFELAAPGRDADFVPGEIIVKFRASREALQMVQQATLQAAGVTLSRARTLALARTALYRAAAADRAATLALIDALNARPDVAYAHPNYQMEAFLQPNDEFYDLMWHYPFVDLEGAWDVTTGSSTTVVAVLDTGMLFGHPDAPVNLLGGYDFVSDPTNNDDDGRDGDPTDPGPRIDIGEEDGTGYHGTHVTGTIAAATNNDYHSGPGADGIAGVSWSSSVLPVRVLGPRGDIVDIAEAIIWSAGGSVPGVPTNNNPADVINLSLGGQFDCSNAVYLQDAINQAATLGSMVVAAAGNGGKDFVGDDASGTSPAGCAKVLTVGAWTVEGERASYSNWGEVVDLMAPGGSSSPGTDANGDGIPDGVLSLGYDDGSSAYTYMWASGTSMATPHVSGVIALILTAKPSLSRTQISDILVNTAMPYASSECDAGQNIPSATTVCGAGLLDARAAVEAAGGATPPADGELTFSPESVALDSDLSSATVALTNEGLGTMEWKLLGALGHDDNPEEIGNNVLYGTQDGVLFAGGTQDVTVGIFRNNVTSPGAYTAYYLFDTDGDASTAEAQLPVTFIIPNVSAPSVSGPSLVEALLTTTWERSGGQSSTGSIRDFEFSVTAGSNYIYAWSDEDDDGFISSGDWYGDYPHSVVVDSGESVTGLDFSLSYVTSRPEAAKDLPEGIRLEDIERSR